VIALLPYIRGQIIRAWDPAGANDSQLVTVLRSKGIDAIGTTADFLTVTTVPPGVTDVICNPPYGENKRGELAVAFIEHALELPVRRIAMLLRADFDSALGRQHIFRHCPRFAGKVVLLNRIRWFAGPSSPSDNHCWFTWASTHIGPPSIHYVTRAEAEGK
jgi:hypothetical protein